jgi:serine/threonine protein kinase
MENRPNIEDILSGFDAARIIGKGGMASIYLYENRLTGEQLAVKMLHSHAINDESAINRFFHEVQASLRLDHRNIVKVLGYGEWQGNPAIVMEYIEGGDLKSSISRIERVPVAVTSYIAWQLFKGLDYSHRLGIVHRDIKPSNIMIDKSGQIKITDFGISQVSDLTRLTISGDVIGTPAYMSPEQASGKKLDERSDIFSAGVLLYELLTHTNPFLAENPSVTLLNIIRCNPPPVFELNPAVPYKLEVALDRLMTRKPEDRIQSASEAAELMKSIAQESCSKEFTEEQFVEFLKNPEEFTQKISLEDSLRYLEKGKTLLTQEKDRPEKAAVEFYRSLFLCPGNREAKKYLDSLTKKFSGDDSRPTEKLLELEQFLRADPNNVAVLMQIIKRARAEGDFIKAINYSKRLARLRPDDVYILGQIETLLPDDHLTSVITSGGRSSSGSDTISATRSSDRSPTLASPVAKRPSKTVSTRPVSQPVKTRTSDYYFKPNMTLIIFALVIVGAVASGLFFAGRFNKATEHIENEIPGLLEFLNPDSRQSPGMQISIGEDLDVREREFLYRARDAFRDGDRAEAIRFYEDFLKEYPDHSEAHHVRIQLSRIYTAKGDTESAIRVLDDQVRKGPQALTAIARLEKIRIYVEQGKEDEARWECTYLEPMFRRLPSPELQIEYLNTYANLSRNKGAFNDAVRLYDMIIRNYSDRDRILEARLMKADALISLGNDLDAQRELWQVRDQSRPGSLIHKTAVDKLGSLSLGDPASYHY